MGSLLPMAKRLMDLTQSQQGLRMFTGILLPERGRPFKKGQSDVRLVELAVYPADVVEGQGLDRIAVVQIAPELVRLLQGLERLLRLLRMQQVLSPAQVGQRLSFESFDGQIPVFNGAAKIESLPVLIERGLQISKIVRQRRHVVENLRLEKTAAQTLEDLQRLLIKLQGLLQFHRVLVEAGEARESCGPLRVLCSLAELE